MSPVDLVLKVLLGLFSGLILLKYALFFLVGYRRRRRVMDRSYRGRTSARQVSDLRTLLFVIALVVLLLVRGPENVSFLTGLLVGMTLIRLYFHQFAIPLTREEAPPDPASPMQIMNYAIQAKPARAWKELLMIAVLLIGSLSNLVFQRAGQYQVAPAAVADRPSP